MRALELDFIAGPRRAGALGLALLGAGLIVTVVAAGDVIEARESLGHWEEQRALAEQRARAERRRAAPVRVADAGEARAITAANRIVERLATPWPRLLADTAAAAGPDIALTGLAPDAEARALRLTGIAPGLDAALAFATRLMAVPGFAQVHLAQHDSVAGGGVRFVVAARWSETR
jgi:hypothetical protein